MDRNYMMFIIAYDFGYAFDNEEIYKGEPFACDEAFEIAEKIVNKYIEETPVKDICYQHFYDYVENLMYSALKNYKKAN